MSEINTANKPDPKMVEFYHDQGWMPDWIYYQLNGKSAMENYIDQKRKMQKRFEDRENLNPNVHITSEVTIKK